MHSDPDSPGDRHLHHLLWECYTGMLPLADALFEDTELTLPLAGTLDQIGHRPGSTVADLSRLQPKTQQAISQLVSKLEKLGHVERRLGAGRGVGLYLTPSGERARADCAEREEALDARLRELLGEPTFAELRDGLEQARPSFRSQHHAHSPTHAAAPTAGTMATARHSTATKVSSHEH
jgi:DNA-binding MarR family transcriptional regulator